MRGRLVAAVDARGAMWGSMGLMCFSALVWKLLPAWNAAANLLAALGVWILASIFFLAGPQIFAKSVAKGIESRAVK